MQTTSRVLASLPGRHWCCGWSRPSISCARVVRIGVATKTPVNDVGQATFQTAQCFGLRVTLRLHALVVRTPEWMRAGLGQRHRVQRSVELAIAEPRQAVAHDSSCLSRWRIARSTVRTSSSTSRASSRRVELAPAGARTWRNNAAASSDQIPRRTWPESKSASSTCNRLKHCVRRATRSWRRSVSSSSASLRRRIG